MPANNSFLEYDPNTGLIVYTKAEIMEKLISICKQAYGDSYEVDEGTEMYNLLDIIASSITDMGDAAKAVYDSYSFITAQGAPLDSLVSLAGITRIEGEEDAQLRARYYRFLYSESTGTVDGLTARVQELQTNVRGTSESFIEDVNVYENYTSTQLTQQEAMSVGWTPQGAYTVQPHSILITIKLRDWYEQAYFSYNGTNQILQGTGSSADEIINNIQSINNTIIDYKSLGCGVTVNNTREGLEPMYYFAIAMDAQFKITINLWFITASDETNYGPAVENYIKLAVQEYINGLQLGEDIQYSGIMSAVYAAYNNLGVNDYFFTVGKSSSEIGANDSITCSGYYIGNLSSPSSSEQQNMQLNPTNPYITVPYTAYLNIPDEEIDERITIIRNHPD